MTDHLTPKKAAQLILTLKNSENVRRQTIEGQTLSPELHMLRVWQTRRLQHTYADLAAQPRYAPAIAFFLSDIYGTRDFSQRDHDILRMYTILKRFLPPIMLQFLSMSVELSQLSLELDHALLKVLLEDLGATEITPTLYAEAYYRCNNYAVREHQIDLIREIGQRIDRSVRMPLTATTIKLARRPAKAAGWSELQDFVERGFAAFKHMRRAKKFLHTIETREKRILKRIFEKNADPFAVQ